MKQTTTSTWHHNVDTEGGNPDICVTDRCGNIVCDIGGGVLEKRLANARLIAAAPELLEACQAMLAAAEIELDTIFDCPESTPVYDNCDWFTLATVNKLRNAVRKATS